MLRERYCNWMAATQHLLRQLTKHRLILCFWLSRSRSLRLVHEDEYIISKKHNWARHACFDVLLSI